MIRQHLPVKHAIKSTASSPGAWEWTVWARYRPRSPGLTGDRVGAAVGAGLDGAGGVAAGVGAAVGAAVCGAGGVAAGVGSTEGSQLKLSTEKQLSW